MRSGICRQYLGSDAVATFNRAFFFFRKTHLIDFKEKSTMFGDSVFTDKNIILKMNLCKTIQYLCIIFDIKKRFQHFINYK